MHFSDDAVFTDEYGLRNAGNLIEPCGCPISIQENRQVKIRIVQVYRHLGFGFHEIDRIDNSALSLESLGRGGDSGQRPAARRAPRGPEIENDHVLAKMIGKVQCPPAQQRRRE